MIITLLFFAEGIIMLDIKEIITGIGFILAGVLSSCVTLMVAVRE